MEECNKHQDLVVNLQEAAKLMAILKTGQERIEHTLEAMGCKQDKYIAQTARLESIVTNGLSHNVIEIREKIEAVCSNLGDRVALLERFSWFRDWVTSLRDDLFKNTLKAVFLGGCIYTLLHFGDKLFSTLGVK
jgi:hypothetical protein